MTAGCGEEPGYSRADAVASFSSANPDATEEQAACVVDRLVDRFGVEGLGAELEVPEQSPEFIEVQFRDMFACGLEGDVRTQIIEQLEANAVPSAAAPCVADELMDGMGDEDIDVLLSGDITDDFLAKFIGAMEDCGAVNQDGS